jgi:RimJ/RimL family protein N-acetyltransferase
MKLKFRKANINDAKLYFNWANDKLVRKNSFQQEEINYSQHINWFTDKLNSSDCFLYLFLNENEIPVGQVRIDKSNSEIIIGVSIDKNHRGKNLGVEMIEQACNDYFKQFPNTEILAYIKQENEPSIKLFKKAGFIEVKSLKINGSNSFKYRKTM